MTGIVLFSLTAKMHATIRELILLLAVRGAMSRQATGDEVIWFPVDDFKDVFESSLGEVSLTKAPYDWLSEAFGRSGRHYRRTDEDDEANSLTKTFWETEKIQHPMAATTEDPITFPEEVARRADACQTNCPQTPQYHPVCGSDGVNYNNMAALNCAKLCGKSVRFAHYGICGRSLPGIFYPQPRRPRLIDPRSL